MRTGLRAHYEERKKELDRALSLVSEKSDRLSSQRGWVMLVMIGGALAAWLGDFGRWLWAAPALCLLLFIALVVRHALIASEELLLAERTSYVKAGLGRMLGEPAEEPATKSRVEADRSGARFLVPDHPNASDLDLFGPNSLFLALSRCETAIGEETLAGYLSKPAKVAQVTLRQEAAIELLETPVLMEDLSIWGRRAESRGRSEEPLAVWGEAPQELPVEGKPHPRSTLVALAKVLVPLTALSFLAKPLLVGLSPWLGHLFWLPFVGQVLVLGALYKPIDKMVTFVSSREAPFGRFRALFERVEAMKPQNELLRRAVGALSSEDILASREIAKLERIIGFADLRHNPIIHVIVNLAFLYDVWVALALERWRMRSGKRARAWLHAVGEIEALASAATYAGEHPSYCFPNVEEGEARLIAEELGHPLIPAARRVENAVDLPEPGRAMLVTGSNMSGKSTYLRSLGLLAVMANGGLPVCAKSASLTPMTTWTSMRIADALSQGMSHFYAELVRLRAIVDAAKKGTVLFLLDEILHGTNSRERTIGARGVVLDLVRGGAIGAVSTHDYALISIADESGGRIETVHFSDRVEDGKMLFDYKLKSGVVQSTNAIRLMKAVGIEVDYGL